MDQFSKVTNWEINFSYWNRNKKCIEIIDTFKIQNSNMNQIYPGSAIIEKFYLFCLCTIDGMSLKAKLRWQPFLVLIRDHPLLSGLLKHEYFSKCYFHLIPPRWQKNERLLFLGNTLLCRKNSEQSWLPSCLGLNSLVWCLDWILDGVKWY